MVSFRPMPPDTAVLFPGQGSHADGMDEPYRGSDALERGLALLDFDPFDRLDEGTRFQQPAIFLCSVAAWESREAAARQPLAGAGHSLGEYAALVSAGALVLEDALDLVVTRADAMAAAPAGGMVAMLGGDEQQVRALGRRLELTIANDNAPGQLVLSGPLEQIEQAEAQARDIGARARRLPVSGAFHSPLMAPAAERLAAAIARVEVAAPSFTVFSAGTAEPFRDIRSELVENLLRGVRWRETLIALRDAGAEDFEEVGPGRILSGLVKRTLAVAA